MSEGKKEILLGDCLELMKDIPNGSIDMILCDLPYGTTACKWDSVIPFDPLWKEYERIIKPNGAILLFGTQPFTKIPEFLSMADVVVIPQRDNIATKGQVPAKVFDAMAMAKPVVATGVSDLAEILEDCGWITEPQNPEKLAQTISAVLRDLPQAENMGKKARKKCIEKYSWRALEKDLVAIFQKYE